MNSENPSSADNQQERFQDLDVHSIPSAIGYYLAGFTDGEGSFHVAFRKRQDYKLPWKVSLCFNVAQKDKVVLALFKQYLKCGTLRQRQDGIWYYEVNNLSDLLQKVIPFFEQFQFLSVKKARDFGKFKQLAELVKSGEHLSVVGLKRILEIRQTMNDGGSERRKYTDADILRHLENPQRLYAEAVLDISETA
jgi:LAGLIDADG endonuclease